ncbi:predicted protein [Postia placenta Mad-698-R]|nr:predicted protein [Postia placenta Mad-698-R]
MSLSILQVLSVLSFLTSILAVLHVGAGPLHRLSSKFDADVHPASHLNLNVGKQHLWNWSGLPVSFSLSTFIGDESREQGSEKGVSGYMGGSDLVRMNWQVGRPRLVPQVYNSQPPLSMAKIIMSRHTIEQPNIVLSFGSAGCSRLNRCGLFLSLKVNDLDGANNRSAADWKVFYVDHMEQLNELVSNLSNLDIASKDENTHCSQPTVTKSQPQPTLHTLQADARPHRYWTCSPSCRVPVTAGRQDTSPKSPSARRGGVHARQDKEVPLAQLAVWPSGPPAEPSFLLDRRKSKRRPFTEKERQYAIEVILWELVCNPELTMQEMCRILVKKMPYRPYSTWTSWCGRTFRETAPEQLLQLAKQAHENSPQYQNANVEGNRSPDLQTMTSSSQPFLADSPSNPQAAQTVGASKKTPERLEEHLDILAQVLPDGTKRKPMFTILEVEVLKYEYREKRKLLGISKDGVGP